MFLQSTYGAPVTSTHITWRVVAAMICGTISGALLAMAIGQAVLFQAAVLSIGAGLGGLLAAAVGLLIVQSAGSPRRTD